MTGDDVTQNRDILDQRDLEFGEGKALQRRGVALFTGGQLQNEDGQTGGCGIDSGTAEGVIGPVDYVVNYKQLEKGQAKPSSIIKLTSNGTVTVIRE